MNTKLIGTAVIAIVIGFAAGYYLHPSPAPETTTSLPRGGGSFTGARGGGGPNGGGFLTGAVASKDASSITINTRDGSSHVVLITPSTTVSKSVTGAISDVSIGSNIMVTGTTNSDGSVSATVVQLRPTMPTPATAQ